MGAKKKNARPTANGWHADLTEKQRRFCEAYSANGGNALAAARKAGYSQPEKQGSQLLGNSRITAALDVLRQEPTRAAIATREERQAFWTRVMCDQEPEGPGLALKDRLKASELLGKSQADFLDRHEHSGPDGGPIPIQRREPATAKELEQIAARLKAADSNGAE